MRVVPKLRGKELITQSRELRRQVIKSLTFLKDFVPNINKKSQLEIDEKQDEILKILDFDSRSRLTPKDRAEVQHVYFGIDYKTRALFSIHFPKVDKILTDKIFH